MRCSQAVLDFLTATDVGRRVLAGEDAWSEASEWELRELREREEEREAEAEELGAAGELGAGEKLPLFLPRPLSWHRQTRSKGMGRFSFVIFLWDFLGAHLYSWDRPAEGRGELETCRHRADSGQETDCT